MNAQINANPFTGSTHFDGEKIHLGVCGSVAAYKIAEPMRAWLSLGIKVSATLTAGARQFVSDLLFRSLGADPVYGEMFSARDAFDHLEPGRLAKAMIVAPASANAISRLASGCASDMLSAQALAFPGPMIIAPAMNPRMWTHPATQANIKMLVDRGARLVEPEVGKTACGETGKGRLANGLDIFLALLAALSPQDMAGLNVMVTLGPTRESWDAVRFLSNPSSGRMGAAMATCAWLRGARVTAICGPGITASLPSGISRINVETALEMLAAAEKIWPEMNMGIFCAAVADFAPVRPDEANSTKIKKDQVVEEIRLCRNPDILATLSKKRGNNQKILGFAAEITTNMADLVSLANKKLYGKNADILAANSVNRENGAFGSDNVAMAVVERNGNAETWMPQPKADVAWELCSWLLRI